MSERRERRGEEGRGHLFGTESVRVRKSVQRSAPYVEDINAEPVAVDRTHAHTESISGVRNEQDNGE